MSSMKIFRYLFTPWRGFKHDTSDQRAVFRFVIGLHLLFVLLCVLVWNLGTATPRWATPQNIADYVTIFGGVQIVVNLTVILVSLRNEAYSRRAYDIAVNSRGAVLHTYEDFKDHLIWVKDNFSVDQWGNCDKLQIIISTPVYGLANQDDFASADIFLDFLESWADHSSKLKPSADPDESPIIEYCCWNQEENRKFGSAWMKYGGGNNLTEEISARLKRFAAIMAKFYKANDQRRIRFRLYFSDESQTRWFSIKKGAHQKGLGLIFTPLTPSSIRARAWKLLGISYTDIESFASIKVFTERLQFTDHEKHEKEDHVALLTNAQEWVADHYGIPREAVKH